MTRSIASKSGLDITLGRKANLRPSAEGFRLIVRLMASRLKFDSFT